jgi:hypothetical protein
MKFEKNKNVLHEEHFICRREIFVTRNMDLCQVKGDRCLLDIRLNICAFPHWISPYMSWHPIKRFVKSEWFSYLYLYILCCMHIAHTLQNMHMTLFDSWNCWNQPSTSEILSRREICMFFFLSPPPPPWSHSPPFTGNYSRQNIYRSICLSHRARCLFN